MLPTCILIFFLTTGDCIRSDGECLCVEPGELTATLEAQPDMRVRLLAAVEQAKERAND